MPFKKGEKIPGQGRPKGSKAAQAKAKFIKEWARIFKEQGRDILEALAKEQPLEFCKLGISLFPKAENESNTGGISIVIQTTRADEL
ncbi:MAG: hypothetical protein QG641_3025 [Candidatus Poribacteria bacterium]|nr:hypothetical protein [Euryarchaeota archaeon]MDQ1329733.1 hypothetical protein [Candidatus Poribacteria bacterium]MDQ1353053.1 hypothetical protein [Acidobacteriota bacterium]